MILDLMRLAGVIYNFVWHTFCDWYIEFLKPIFNSKNKSLIDEAKVFSTYILSNILKLLHPFIPFFTEYAWKENNLDKILKSDLINAHWPKTEKMSSFNQSSLEIETLIQIISSIRSTKVQLNIPPKEYCNIIFFNETKKIKKSINSNVDIIKQVGRVNNIVVKEDKHKNVIQIIVLNEKIGLEFDTNIDVQSQIKRLLEKQNEIENKINLLNKKLSNNEYLKKAPKDIVDTDKDLLKDLKIEQIKLKSILSSIN